MSLGFVGFGSALVPGGSLLNEELPGFRVVLTRKLVALRLNACQAPSAKVIQWESMLARDSQYLPILKGHGPSSG